MNDKKMKIKNTNLLTKDAKLRKWLSKQPPNSWRVPVKRYNMEKNSAYRGRKVNLTRFLQKNNIERRS